MNGGSIRREKMNDVPIVEEKMLIVKRKKD